MVSDRLADAYIPDVIPEDDLKYFDQGGHGARIGWGDQPAILVVDMTNAFTGERSSEGRRAVESTADLLDVARENDVPICYTVPDRDLPDWHHGSTKPKAPSASGRSGTNTIDSELEVTDEDIVLEKPRASAFFDTHLATTLHQIGIDTIILAGLTTSGCVRASAVDSHSHGFNTIIARECTADRSLISHQVSLFDIDMKYADVTPINHINARLRSLDY